MNNTYYFILRELEKMNSKNAWAAGVKLYAYEILENIKECEDDLLTNSKLLNKALLNGASNWTEYSEGGCSLIYDGDIAERLCTPSEFKRKDHGRLNPNSRETWLDVQTRALYQASSLIRGCYYNVFNR